MNTQELQNKKPNNAKVNSTAIAMQVYSGPIPSANELKKYEDVLPGAAERIIAMAENQSRHRQKNGNENVRSKH